MRRLLAVAIPVVLTSVAAVAGAGSSAADPPASAAQRQQSTQLISRAAGGGLPNGASTNAVISNDKRFARVIASSPTPRIWSAATGTASATYSRSSAPGRSTTRARRGGAAARG